MGQSLLRGFPTEFAVAIPAVVLLFKTPGGMQQLLGRSHHDLAEELLVIVVVELLDDPIAPRFVDGDELGLNPVLQAQPDKRSHPAGMSRAAVEAPGVVHLEVPGDPHPLPERPERIDDALPGLAQQGLQAATRGSEIHGVEAVEPHRTPQVTGTHEICLVGLVGLLGRIGLPLGRIPPAATLGQTLAAKDPFDGADRHQRSDPHLLEFPVDGLGAAEQIVMVQCQ